MCAALSGEGDCDATMELLPTSEVPQCDVPWYTHIGALLYTSSTYSWRHFMWLMQCNGRLHFFNNGAQYKQTKCSVHPVTEYFCGISLQDRELGHVSLGNGSSSL